MARNIEVKARIRDAAAAHAIAARLSGGPPERIDQTDVFFDSPDGRLKLRILAPDRGELIHYRRPDIVGCRRSDYTVARTADPNAMLGILERTLRRRGAVVKTRWLYLAGQTRIHIDELQGLGDFLEFEVVLRPEQTDADGERIAHRLLEEFGIAADALIGEAYIDLLGRSLP